MLQFCVLDVYNLAYKKTTTKYNSSICVEGQSMPFTESPYTQITTNNQKNNNFETLGFLHCTCQTVICKCNEPSGVT